MEAPPLGERMWSGEDEGADCRGGRKRHSCRGIRFGHDPVRVPLDSLATVGPDALAVTHEECLRHIAKKRIWNI